MLFKNAQQILIHYTSKLIFMLLATPRARSLTYIWTIWGCWWEKSRWLQFAEFHGLRSGVASLQLVTVLLCHWIVASLHCVDEAQLINVLSTRRWFKYFNEKCISSTIHSNWRQKCEHQFHNLMTYALPRWEGGWFYCILFTTWNNKHWSGGCCFVARGVVRLGKSLRLPFSIYYCVFRGLMG